MNRHFLPLCAAMLCACIASGQSKNFKAVSLNVDGLPESLLGGAVKMNVGGPLEAGSKAMGEFISTQRTDWDLFALSEDFNFEDELKAGLGDGKYTFGTHRGKMYNKIDVLTSPFDTDGLNVMVRNNSGITFSGETYVRFTDSYGKTSDGSDELIKKGFRYYLINFGDGLTADLYIHHMDAETDDKSNAARESNVKQVIKYILDRDAQGLNTRPILIMGDSNCRYTRDNLEEWVFNTVNNYTDANGLQPYQVRDPWIDFQWYGVAPKLGSPSLMVGTYGAQKGEVVDKVWYINNKKANGVQLIANSFLNDEGFKSNDPGVAFADHPPIVIDFTIKKVANADDVFQPAIEAPANPFGDKSYYLRSMLTGDYITGGGYWDGQVLVDKPGAAFTIQTSDNNTFKLNSVFTANMLGSNLYVDGVNTDWSLTKVSGSNDIYVISTLVNNVVKVLTASKNSDTTPYYHPDYKATLEDYHPGDHAQQWEVISEEERTNRLTTEGHIHPDRWLDVTYKVPCYNFPNNNANFDKWSRTGDVTASVGSSIRAASSLILEWDNKQTEYGYGGVMHYYSNSWSVGSQRTEFTFETTINNLPNGTYRFKFQLYNCNLNNGSDKNLTVTAGNRSINPDATSGASHNDFKAAGRYFRDGNGWVTIDNITVTDGTLKISFVKGHTKRTATSFTIDNLRLEYQPASNPAEQSITLDFPMHYNTMILPFDLPDTEVQKLNNDNLQVFRVTGITPKKQDTEVEGSIEYYKIEKDICNTVAANIPYIVVNNNVEELKGREMEGTNPAAAPRKATATKASGDYTYTFTGKPMNTNYYYTDSQDPDRTLTGVLVDTNVYPEHYALGNSEFLQAFFRNDNEEPQTVKAYRAYVNKVPAVENGASRTLPMLVFNDDTNILTGVEEVADDAEETITDETPVDVYTTGGILLRRGVAKADALTDLPRGLYILTNGLTSLKVAK